MKAYARYFPKGMKLKKRLKNNKDAVEALASALIWNADKFTLAEGNAVISISWPLFEPKGPKDLRDLLRTNSLIPIRLTDNLLNDLQNIYTKCLVKNLYLTHIYVKDRAKFFHRYGLPESQHLLGIQVRQDALIEDDSIVLVLSKFPTTSLISVAALLKGEYAHDIE